MTNTKNNESKRANRFENRVTVLKGEVLNSETLVKNPFEIEVPYVRSVPTAMKSAEKALNLSEDEIIVKKSFEVINVTPKSVRYSNSKLADNAEAVYNSEEEALDACADGYAVKAVTVYTVHSVVWSIGGDMYNTDKVSYETTSNITKADARAFVRMRFEKETGDTVLALHNTHKTDSTKFAVISNERLSACVIESEK